VKAIHAVKPAAIRQQIEILFENFPIRAVKTGMLHSAEIIREVAAALAKVAEWRDADLPLVVDPVLVDSDGERLVGNDAVAAYRDALFPLADLITPNLDEVHVLTGIDVTDYIGMKTAGAQLAETYECAVVVKGGGLGEEEGVARDYLVTEQGAFRLEAPFTPDFHGHGTGCTFSAALTAHLALGERREEATESAKKFVTAAIAKNFKWALPGSGESIQALNPFSAG
jgi:hydroxymethylpyrimidine/phosphomethylpyrimidine kinase